MLFQGQLIPQIPENFNFVQAEVNNLLRIGQSAPVYGSAAGTVRSYANVVRGNRHDVSRMLFQGQLIPQIPENFNSVQAEVNNLLRIGQSAAVDGSSRTASRTCLTVPL